MTVNIDRYPHAFYDDNAGMGYLVYYYPYDAVKEETIDKADWKSGSYSPEVLNYKEGKLKDIQYFAAPFVQLIQYALKKKKISTVYLVPVPSSTAFNSKNFSTEPRSNTSPRNRDNRNLLFCRELAKLDKRFVVADILRRIKGKKPKEKWAPKQHADSIQVVDNNVVQEFFPTFVLIDDVCTTGSALKGCNLVLEHGYLCDSVTMLAISRTMNPQNFESI
ncbi:MAG: hypothetical protein K2Y22_02170 [Candidatus Obscuribacterales bacterium]|nr:hypothetical protein [Candidatus Obscuribacterales bacterium]